MSRVVEFVVDMLPLDPPGRRAVDETLADWRHEAGEARTVARRVAAAVQGSVAVTVAVASVAARDAFSAQTFRIVGLVVGAACLMAIGFRFRSFERHAATLAERGLADANLVGLWASMLPPAISFCIPLALLAPPVRRVATRSLIGPCLVLTALSAVNLGWISPLANQWFRQTSADILRQPDSPLPSQRPGGHQSRPDDTGFGTLAEYTALDLVRESRSAGTSAPLAAADLNSRGALLAMVPVCLILGVQARRLGAARRWRVGAGLLAWVTLFAGWFTAILGSSVVVHLILAQYELLASFRPWAVPLVCSSLALAIAWLAQQSEIRNSSAQPIFI